MYPLIFVHGICPFDRLYMPFVSLFYHGDKISYFKGIKSFLQKMGYIVFTPQISWGGSLQKRAEDLYQKIILITSGFKRFRKVHLIGHSMGGLDIRAMLYKFDLKDQIASITTIGTPHLGTTLADLKLPRMKPFIISLKKLKLDITGFMDLTTQKARELNNTLEIYEKESGVVLRTIAGRQPNHNIFFLLRQSHRVLEAMEGENDGLVSVRSAMYKEEYLYDIWDLDHLNQIGWWDPSEPIGKRQFYNKVKALYLKMITDLPE